MSSYIGTFGQCFANTRRQNGSISQNATVCIPARSSPRLKPPMPLNRSRTHNLPRLLGASKFFGSELPTLLPQACAMFAYA